MGRQDTVSTDKIVAVKIIVLLCFCFDVARAYPGGPDTTLVLRACSSEIQVDSAYGIATSYLLLDLIQTSVEGYDYYASTEFDGAIMFGHGACNGALSQVACNVCLNAAEDALVPCAGSTGAQVQLKDCRVRYENYPFVE